MALKTYQEAIRLGEINPKAVLRTVELLRRRHRFSEANELLAKMEERRMPVTPDLAQSGVEVALLGQDYASAHDWFDKLQHISKLSKWQEQVWEGQMLAYMARHAERDGRIPEAEREFAEADKAFHRAIEINDKAPEAWLALVSFLTSLNKEKLTQQAREEVVKARAHLPPKESHITFAQMYEFLKDKENCQKEYEAAYAVAPDDPTSIRSLADFYGCALMLEESQPLLEKLVDPKRKIALADRIWGRRQLALMLAAQGGYPKLQEAMKMIEENLASGEMAAEDLRAKATFQAIDPRRATRLEAPATMEILLRNERGSKPQDRFTTAKFYLALGNLPKFREHMQILLAKESEDLNFLVTYISAELKHKEIAEAELWLNTLEKAAPNQYATAHLRASALVRRNQPDEAMAVLEKFVERSNISPDERLAGQRQAVRSWEEFAELLTETNPAAADRFLKKAEQVCRLYVGKRPEHQMMLVGFLARRGRIQEALAAMDPNWAACDSFTVAQALEDIVKNATPIRAQNEHIEKIIQGAEEISRAIRGESPSVHTLVAGLCQLYHPTATLCGGGGLLPRGPENGAPQRPDVEQLRHAAGPAERQARRGAETDQRCHGLFRSHGRHARYARDYLPRPKRARKGVGRHANRDLRRPRTLGDPPIPLGQNLLPDGTKGPSRRGPGERPKSRPETVPPGILRTSHL